MNTKKILALVLMLVLICTLAACGAKDDAATVEPKNAEEAVAMYKDLMAQENAILSQNTDLWEKVYREADKGMSMLEDGKNYGDYLLDTIDAAKDQFTADELKLLKSEAKKIRDIESKLTVLEEKYPDEIQNSMESDSSMSMSANSDSMGKFPSFEGKDLDGNEVKSSELFSANAVTVVNFWFTACSPCVSELAELDALNKELADKGGALIGINASTLDGDETEISDAKNVLEKKGATYQNVYFDSASEAGKFVEDIYAYPTTYVVDRNGNIVGEPLVGVITEKSQKETLQSLIDTAIAADTN